MSRWEKTPPLQPELPSALDAVGAVSALELFPAVQEDGQARGQRRSEELGGNVEKRDAHIAGEDDGGADGTGGVQAGAGVLPTW